MCGFLVTGANAKKSRMPCDSGDLALTLASQHPIIWLQQYLVLARVCHTIAVHAFPEDDRAGNHSPKGCECCDQNDEALDMDPKSPRNDARPQWRFAYPICIEKSKKQFETMWCHQHQTWMGSPVHGHFDGKIVEHVELNEGCPQQNTLYYFIIFQSRFQFLGENIGKRN